MPSVEEADRNWEEILDWHDRRHLWARDVQIEPVRWLWGGFIPRGMPTLLTGEEGLGKSQLANQIVAAFSRGAFGDEPGLVKYYTAEDPAKQVLVPRLIANAADLGTSPWRGSTSRRFFRRTSQTLPGKSTRLASGFWSSIP